MRLLTACVRNYRVHRECRIEFTPDRTVIAGPNESGKSTFAEALHRALFVPATVTGNLREAMLSHLPGAPQTPEVELEFTHDGKRYCLFKRFAGQRGVQELRIDGRTFRGDEATEQLAHLLRNHADKRMTANNIDAQWAHLFIWQDASASDPLVALGAEQARLQQALRKRAGAEVLVSPRDARALDWLRARWAESMTPTGQIRAGSALAQAIAAERAATFAVEAAEQVVQRVDQHARSLERCDAEIARCEQLLADTTQFLTERQQRHDELVQLTRQREAIWLRANELGRHQEQLAMVRQRLHELATQATARQQQHATTAHQLQLAEAMLDQRQGELAALRQQQSDRRKELEAVRQRGEQLLQAERNCLELGQQQQRWQQQLALLDQAEQDLARLAAAAADRAQESQRLHAVLASANDELATQQQRLDAARLARQHGQDELHRLRTLCDDWQAVVEREEARAAVATHQRAADRLQGLRSDLARLQQELQRTQAPNQQELAALDELARTEAASRAAIAAMATRLQVEAGSGTVRLDDENLPPGATVTLLEPALLQIGDVSIRLFPGGGRGVAEARQQLSTLEAELRAALARNGVTTLAEAHERHALRAELSRDLERHQRQWAAEQPDAVEQALAAARQHLQRKEAQVTALCNRSQPLAELLATADAATAQHGRAQAQQQAAAAGQAVQDLDAAARRAEADVDRARTLLARTQAELTLLGNADSQAQGEQKVLEQTHGDAATRASQRREWLQQCADAAQAIQQLWAECNCADGEALRQACLAAQQSLQQANRQIDELEAASNRCHAALLQAEQAHTSCRDQLATLELAAERERGELLALEREHGDALTRAQREAAVAADAAACAAELASVDAAVGGDSLATLQLALAGLRRDEAANRNRIQNLRAEGAQHAGALQSIAQGQDPFAELSLRQEALRQARALLAEREAELAALRDLIQRLEAQTRRIVQHYAAEFDRVVHKYLAPVFGQRVQVAVSLGDQGDSFAPIGDLQVDRQGFLSSRFAALSRGAQEQVAVAIRLAAAEVLAKEGDGKLPILLDDSFVHSDAARMLGLRAMIETAGAAGLQVIVFTCDERAYGSADVRLVRTPMAADRVLDAPRQSAFAAGDEATVAGDAVEVLGPRSIDGAAEPAVVNPEQLLRMLERHGGAVSNPALQKALGWSSADYERIKEELVASGRAIKGQGRGGTLRLP